MKPRTTTSESFAALGQKVEGLDNDYQDLRSHVVDLAKETKAGFSAIHAKLDERSRTPWGQIYTGLGLLLAFFSTIGALAYLPIKSEIERVTAREQYTLEKTVGLQREFDFLRGQLHPLKP